MDGTGIVALIIVIMFFASYPVRIIEKKETAKPAATPEATTQTTSTAATPATAPATTTAVATTTTSNDGYVVYMDKPDAQYEYISYDRMDALIKRYNKNISKSDADRIKIAVNRYCKEKNIDPKLVLALMARESAFKADSVSPSGAIGLGQIMPFNYERLGIKDPYDVDQNAKGVIYYMREKLDDWKGNNDQIGLALASYLKGTGEIKRAGGTYDGHAKTYVSDILRIRTSI